jgi:chromosome partitioning protein
MILAVGNTKGGVGKTTIAVNLAIMRAIAGRDVWLIDGDSQGTAQTAIRIRFDDGRQPGIACSAYSEGSILRAQLKLQGGKFEDIVIDVGARDSTALRAALMLADVLLIPFQPRSFDVWALSDIVSLIKDTSSMRDGLRCYAILNMADPTNTSDNIEAAETVKDFPQLTYLPTVLRRRKSFANAAGAGLCVFELSPRDKDIKACDEMKALYEAVFQEGLEWR